jgi:hypothetical protein
MGRKEDAGKVLAYRISRAGLPETLGAQKAGIALSTGSAAGFGIVAGMRETVINSEPQASHEEGGTSGLNRYDMMIG